LRFVNAARQSSINRSVLNMARLLLKSAFHIPPSAGNYY
jgi:hypothetical protein